MNFEAYLVNNAGCHFDGTTFSAKTNAAAIAAGKRWAANRGGKYKLNVSEVWELAGNDWTTTIGRWRYFGTTRNAVAVPF